MTLLGLLNACSGDCDDVKLGNIETPELYNDYIVQRDGDELVYKNEAGESVTFITEFIDMEAQIFVDEISRTPSVQGPIVCIEYYGLSSPLLQFANDVNNTTLQLQMLALGDTEDDLTYEILISAGSTEFPDGNQISGGAHGRYNISKDQLFIDENNESTFTALDSWEAHGKTYTDVWAFQNSTGEVYFSRGVGIIAYKDVLEELWVLE